MPTCTDVPGSVDAMIRATSLTIPNSVNTISASAFRVNNLTSITMPKNGITIGSYMLTSTNKNFQTAYNTYGMGTYTGTQTGTWTKI